MARSADVECCGFCRHGYAAAARDVRGRFDSEGEWYPFALEAEDGYDTVEWLASRDWSDGQVGTVGLSYGGSDQHALASLAPDAMRQSWSGDADFGIDAPMDDYDGYRLRFFDAALRGLDTGFFEGPPVHLFVMGGGSGLHGPGRRHHSP